jgi:PPOX class probable FMN-dependent enzyme
LDRIGAAVRIDDALARRRFRDIVTTESQLRDIVGPPNRWFTSKIVTKLDGACRRFIAKSPFVVIGSTGVFGQDLSPKGDPPGFVRVLDDSTLAIPDRVGNRRVDTFHNVLHDPRVGLIFFVPGARETLRVGGTAILVRDQEIRESMTIDRRVPELAMIVTIERAFFHCGKCITRSKLWDSGARADRAGGVADDAGQAAGEIPS